MKEKTVIPINQEEINSYLKDIRKIKVMTPERERELAEKMLSGNLTLQEKHEIHKELVEGNLRFVITVSKQYQNQQWRKFLTRPNFSWLFLFPWCRAYCKNIH